MKGINKMITIPRNNCVSKKSVINKDIEKQTEGLLKWIIEKFKDGRNILLIERAKGKKSKTGCDLFSYRTDECVIERVGRILVKTGYRVLKLRTEDGWMAGVLISKHKLMKVGICLTVRA